MRTKSTRGCDAAIGKEAIVHVSIASGERAGRTRTAYHHCCRVQTTFKRIVAGSHTAPIRLAFTHASEK